MQPPRSALLLVAVLAAWRSRTAQGQERTDVELSTSEPLTTFDENNFGDRPDSTLKEGDTYSYTLGNGYKCALSGWTHTRDYAKGYIRNTDGSAFAKVSGLIPGAPYAWKVYQFASAFSSPVPINSLLVNKVAQGLTPQDESKAPSKSGVSTADSSGQIIFEFKNEKKQVHLSALALAKRGPPCTKWKTTGWHTGTYHERFSASQAPDGQEWSWQQCASRCADELDCDFWTLQQDGGRCAMMVGEQGKYNDQGGHAEGAKTSGCGAFTALRSDISVQQSDLAVSKKDISNLNNAFATSFKQIDALQKEGASKSEQIKKLTQTKSDLEMQVKILMNGKDQVTQSLQVMTMQKEGALKQLEMEKEGALKQQEMEKEAALKQQEQWQAVVATKSLELENMTKVLEDNRISKSELNMKLALKTKSLEQMMKKFDAATTQLQELTATKDVLGMEKNSIEMQLSAKKIEAQTTAEHLAETKAAKDELQREYSDPSVQHFLEMKALKVYEHPGVYHAVNKTFKYVLPSLKMRYDQGQGILDTSRQRVHDKLNAFVGSKTTEPYLPMMAGFLVYGIAIVPFCCAVGILTRALCSWRELLVFCHIWFTLTCFAASCFAGVSGAEPLAVLAMHDASVYLASQVVVGILLTIYALFMLLSWFLCSAGGTREPCYRLIQTTILTPPLLVYLLFIWTPTMQDRLPEMDKLVLMALKWAGLQGVVAGMWIPYLMGTIVFAAEGVLELLCFKASKKKRKLDYIESKLKVRDLEELSRLVPGKRLRLDDDSDEEKTA